jgi:CBS domain-containing protein
MKVKDVMTRDIEHVEASDTIQDAAMKMRKLNVGFMPVWSDGAVVGVLTDRDLAVRAVAEGRDSGALVEEVATAGPITCDQEIDVVLAARKMMDAQVRRLLVTDGDGLPVGVVSLGDLAVTMDMDHAGEVLKAISEPSEPAR